MSGQVKSGQVRWGPVSSHQVRSGQVRSSNIRKGHLRSGRFRSGQIRPGQVQSGQVRSGQVRSGQIRSGQVKLGQVWSGQVRSGCLHKALALDLWSCFVYCCTWWNFRISFGYLTNYALFLLPFVFFCFSGGQLLRPLVLLYYISVSCVFSPIYSSFTVAEL